MCGFLIFIDFVYILDMIVIKFFLFQLNYTKFEECKNVFIFQSYYEELISYFILNIQISLVYFRFLALVVFVFFLVCVDGDVLEE